MSKVERQRQIESDSVRDGCVRWAQNIEYQQATDTKPYRNLIGIAWRLLADAIRAEQEMLKTSKAKLPPGDWRFCPSAMNNWRSSLSGPYLI